LSTLGTLAAALAHEIRNPLEAMNLNLELLGRHLGKMEMSQSDQDKKNKYLRILESEVSRLVQITNNFLSFVRPDRAENQTVSVSRILEQIVELVHNQAATKNVEIGMVNHTACDMVQGSEDQLKQVFLNIVLNSLEAMPGGGKLSFSIAPATGKGNGRTNGMIAVRIDDTGAGITPEKMERLFEPFFSDRPHGTGLGLTIARRIIEAHNGHIKIQSEVGKGTSVTVELPLAQSDQPKEAKL